MKRGNKEGTIVAIDNNRWRVQLSLGYREDGTRNRLSKTFKTKAEAIAWRNKMLAQAQDYGAESIKSNNGLFVSNFLKWLNEDYKLKVKSPQYYTAIRNYNNHIKIYFKGKRQTDLTREDFRKFFIHLEKINVGIETRRKMKSYLYQYFENEYVNSPMRNPLDKIPITYKVKEEEIIDPEKYFSSEDYKAIPIEYRQEFLAALDNEKRNTFFKPLCYLMYYSGIRIGEALALQWKDFNFERRYFLVYKAVSRDYDVDENGHKIGKSKIIIKSPKTKEGIRPLALIDIVYEAIMEWKELRKAQEKVSGIPFTRPDSYLFANDKGEVRSEWGTNTMFQKFKKKHNLDGKGIHFHAMRQTLSNTLFELMKNDEASIIKTMGHTKIDTTKRNYHTLGKFDSVQKVARSFNELYPPKNSENRASQNITFAPEGYLSEERGIDLNNPIAQNQRKSCKEDDTALDLQTFIKEISLNPELVKQLQNLLKTK